MSSSMLTVLILSGILGGASFLFGLIPLSFPLSRQGLARLSIFGTGLLLGAALGVIIPEGIETIYEHSATTNSTLTGTEHATPSHPEPPTFKIAISLLCGFTFMLALEQFAASHSHRASRTNVLPLSTTRSTSRPLSPVTAPSIADGDFDLDIDAEIAGLENKQNPWSSHNDSGEQQKDPKLMTFGLVIHSLADGLALGASLASPTESQEGTFSGLSIVVFLALAVHKAPAALALTSTLMTSLHPRAVRTHLVAFSLAAPVSAILTYLTLTWFGTPEDNWTGLALLFSGGTFLYVATLLSPLSTHAHAGEASGSEADLGSLARLALITAGMFTPALVGGLFGHGH